MPTITGTVWSRVAEVVEGREGVGVSEALTL
jgi:hypothetical protein